MQHVSEASKYTTAQLKAMKLHALSRFYLERQPDEALIAIRVMCLKRMTNCYNKDHLRSSSTKALYISAEITLARLEHVLNKRHNIDVNHVEPCDEPV